MRFILSVCNAEFSASSNYYWSNSAFEESFVLENNQLCIQLEYQSFVHHHTAVLGHLSDAVNTPNFQLPKYCIVLLDEFQIK